jgi:hypothetical protein
MRRCSRHLQPPQGACTADAFVSPCPSICRELKKIITKDSHVAVVAEAIACTGNLAQGLRKEYSGPARTFASMLMEKYKDKNTAVVKSVTEALTNMHKHCWPLLDVAEDFTGVAGGKVCCCVSLLVRT